MKSSKRRKQASRANGARSRGPTTPEGKSRSSYNAIRHGLLANCVVLRTEPRESFEALLNQYVERFTPLDDVEFGMIEEMASCYWRLRRGWAIETELLNTGIQKQPPGSELTRLAASFSELAVSPPACPPQSLRSAPPPHVPARVKEPASAARREITKRT